MSQKMNKAFERAIQHIRTERQNAENGQTELEQKSLTDEGLDLEETELYGFQCGYTTGLYMALSYIDRHLKDAGFTHSFGNI